MNVDGLRLKVEASDDALVDTFEKLWEGIEHKKPNHTYGFIINRWNVSKCVHNIFFGIVEYYGDRQYYNCSVKLDNP